MNSEILLSPKDRARLITNDPRLSNRWVKLNKKYYPIMHLSINDLEIFQAVTTEFEKLFKDLTEVNTTFLEFIRDHYDQFYIFLTTDALIASELVLKLPMEQIRKFTPIQILRCIISQWFHNHEISYIQSIYPLPENDEDDIDIGEPKDNPLSTICKLCESFHWRYADALQLTWPQLYLISVESSWSYRKMKAKTDDESPKVKVKQKKKKQTADEYKQYIQGIMAELDQPVIADYTGAI